jgi:predicted RNA-binding protein YlxR (DUF448 family)
MKPKRELIRIVRSKEGDVLIDLTGKQSGRGAYLSKDKECIVYAQKKNILEHHLKAKVNPSLYEQLLELVEKESS